MEQDCLCSVAQSSVVFIGHPQINEMRGISLPGLNNNNGLTRTRNLLLSTAVDKVDIILM